MTTRLAALRDARFVGAALCLSGLALLAWPSLLTAALGVELIAAAFWWWARAAEHPAEQIERWSWLRRPAAALWLAVAIQHVIPTLSFVPSVLTWDVPAVLKWMQSIAVVWAGLELLAALPLARPYSDVPGPLIAMRPWLPALLPTAGFAVLWRQSSFWVAVPDVRDATTVLLLLTAWLASLRALGRRQWTAGLRWLLVSDSAIAAVLVAERAIRLDVSFLLWAGAFGGRAYLLAGELRGAAPRRGPGLSRLWRWASWAALACLAWPLLAALATPPLTNTRLLALIAVAVPVALGAAVTVRRLVEAPERRQLARSHTSLSLGHVAAMLTLVIGPIGLLLAWWGGFETAWLPAIFALIPPASGALAAALPQPAVLSGAARAAARSTSRGLLARERGLVVLLDRLTRGITAPLRDLHTGDAQEYLLFLAGVAVLALVLPLLQ